MGATMCANGVFFVFMLVRKKSHRQVVLIWQMIAMTTSTMSRRFGVEIEFLSTITAQQAITSLTAAGIRVESEGYPHRTTPHWKVVRDGSCGYELVSPVLEGEAGLEEVRIAASALEAAGAKVDKRCGLHVHFDARSMNLKAVKNLFKLWLKFEDVLDTFQPPSRRGTANNYCLTNLDHSIIDAGNHRSQCLGMFRKIDLCKNMEQMKALYPSRYRKLNIHSYFRHQTLEVRHHSGTTSPEKITNWVRLMARMFDAAETATAVRNRPEDNGVGMPRMKWFFQSIEAKGLTKYFTDRAKKLAA